MKGTVSSRAQLLPRAEPGSSRHHPGEALRLLAELGRGLQSPHLPGLPGGQRVAPSRESLVSAPGTTSAHCLTQGWGHEDSHQGHQGL